MSSPMMKSMFGLLPVPPEGAADGVAAFCVCAKADDVSATAATRDDVPRRTLRRSTLSSSSWSFLALIALSNLRLNTKLGEHIEQIDNALMVSLSDQHRQIEERCPLWVLAV